MSGKLLVVSNLQSFPLDFMVWPQFYHFGSVSLLSWCCLGLQQYLTAIVGL